MGLVLVAPAFVDRYTPPEDIEFMPYSFRPHSWLRHTLVVLFSKRGLFHVVLFVCGNHLSTFSFSFCSFDNNRAWQFGSIPCGTCARHLFAHDKLGRYSLFFLRGSRNTFSAVRIALPHIVYNKAATYSC